MNSTKITNVIGIIPAAGKATRLQPIPCSKEVLRVVFPKSSNHHAQPEPVCTFLLNKLADAGIDSAFVILGKNKWDIPELLTDGKKHRISLAYLLLHNSRGTAFTINQAFPYVKNSLVALGFPDILFEGPDGFSGLIKKQHSTHADIVLGIFPSDNPSKVDMVEINSDRVIRTEIKPKQTNLKFTWGIAVWTPRFSRFLNEYIADLLCTKNHGSTKNNNSFNRDIHIGEVIQAAIEQGMHVSFYQVSNTPFIDIGTPEDLSRVTS
ncbi:MAG: sugar phosphate nucleotidyltransferase [Gammaproteobacteria bacterium]